jgi:hypothetical protein
MCLALIRIRIRQDDADHLSQSDMRLIGRPYVYFAIQLCSQYANSFVQRVLNGRSVFTEEAFSLQREHPALQNMTFLNFFLTVSVIFALLEPNPMRIRIRNTDTLPFFFSKFFPFFSYVNHVINRLFVINRSITVHLKWIDADN